MDIFILTGGLSSRMGRPKSNLIFREKSFVELLKTTLPKAKTVGSNEKFEADYPDILPRGSSISGIISALYHADSNLVLILSCDSPFLDQKLLARLMSAKKPTFIVSNGFINPFPGVYKKTWLGGFMRQYQSNNYRIGQIIKSLSPTTIKADKPLNINTPADYKKITRR